MTNEERIERVLEFAENFGCEIQWIGPEDGGMMYVEYEPPMVEIPDIVGQKQYLIGLHELGHVIHGHTQGRPPFGDKRFYFDNGVLKSEAQAWNWAMDVCLETIEPGVASFMYYQCLNTYYTASVYAAGMPTRLTNGNRDHVEFIYDQPDQYFWDTENRILNIANGHEDGAPRVSFAIHDEVVEIPLEDYEEVRRRVTNTFTPQPPQWVYTTNVFTRTDTTDES